MILAYIAHNIRSAENIGSLFRTSDALGVAKIYLTGYTPAVSHPKVKKTALGAEKSVLSEKFVDINDALEILKSDGYKIIGLELDARSTPLNDFKISDEKVALLLGNEVEGIPSYLLDGCDKLIYIPMRGAKESLNVTISAAIATYQLLNNPKCRFNPKSQIPNAK